MSNSMNVVPGEFMAHGHDYRADLARFVREAYALKCTDTQMESIEQALRRYEVYRSGLTEAKTGKMPRDGVYQPVGTSPGSEWGAA
jgi:hypothetical protein